MESNSSPETESFSGLIILLTWAVVVVTAIAWHYYLGAFVGALLFLAVLVMAIVMTNSYFRQKKLRNKA